MFFVRSIFHRRGWWQHPFGGEDFCWDKALWLLLVWLKVIVYGSNVLGCFARQDCRVFVGLTKKDAQRAATCTKWRRRCVLAPFMAFLEGDRAMLNSQLPTATRNCSRRSDPRNLQTGTVEKTSASQCLVGSDAEVAQQSLMAFAPFMRVAAEDRSGVCSLRSVLRGTHTPRWELMVGGWSIEGLLRIDNET